MVVGGLLVCLLAEAAEASSSSSMAETLSCVTTCGLVRCGCRSTSGRRMSAWTSVPVASSSSAPGLVGSTRRKWFSMLHRKHVMRVFLCVREEDGVWWREEERMSAI